LPFAFLDIFDILIVDEFVKSQKSNLLSFRAGSESGMTAKPESSDFSMFWMPDQVRHDECGLFTRPSIVDFPVLLRSQVSPMKKQLYEKMESMFHLIEHNYEDSHPLELMLWQLARGNTYNMRVVGLEGIKRFREEHPDCSITFKPNHLSEADFILLGLLFRENKMRAVTEGGANLFIEDIDIFKDVIPHIVNYNFNPGGTYQSMSIAKYLSNRGAFKVFREPVDITQEDGSVIKLGQKEILSLTRVYRYHIVKEKEMYVTFPGFSEVKSGLFDLLKKNGVKTGRSYTGKIDGYHHLPFQMDIEASLYTDIDVYTVGVNIAYEQVMEDANFSELTRLHDAGVSKNDIYVKDLGYIIKEFCNDNKKGNLSIKFGQPQIIDTSGLLLIIILTEFLSA
jgi:hypothetical protein